MLPGTTSSEIIQYHCIYQLEYPLNPVYIVINRHILDTLPATTARMDGSIIRVLAANRPNGPDRSTVLLLSYREWPPSGGWILHHQQNRFVCRIDVTMYITVSALREVFTIIAAQSIDRVHSIEVHL